MRIASLSARVTIALLGAVTIPATPALKAATATPSSLASPLATPAQVEAEQVLIALRSDPDIKAAQARVRSELAQTAIGRTRDGAARIGEVVSQWTNSLIFKEVLQDRAQPAIVWGTDDTPRTWLGHTISGVGTSGDNPDHIYRSSVVDGSGRYEIVGRYDRDRPAAQFVVSASPLLPDAEAKPPSATAAGTGSQTSVLSDRDVEVGADGSFRLLVGGERPANGRNYIPIAPGQVAIGFRDVLSDWNQRPSQLTIRRLDNGAGKPLDRRDIKRRVLEHLEPYIHLWSDFPNTWFGGLKPNSIVGPYPREGGWGFIAGLRFAIGPDEAVLVTTTRGSARYQGIQVIDPWMIAADGRRHLTSFNPAQARANADGSYSFVIAARDPGVANWLDTAGLHSGFAVLRWQNFASPTDGAGLVGDFRVIKLADVSKILGIAIANPAERRRQLAERARAYGNRTR